jgi:hypothetical protein
VTGGTASKPIRTFFIIPPERSVRLGYLENDHSVSMRDASRAEQRDIGDTDGVERRDPLTGRGRVDRRSPERSPFSARSSARHATIRSLAARNAMALRLGARVLHWRGAEVERTQLVGPTHDPRLRRD